MTRPFIDPSPPSMNPPADIAARIGDRRVVASVSAGKDSIALWCYLIRLGLDPIAVACDTGWEADFEGHRWREYLDGVARRLGQPITVVIQCDPCRSTKRWHGPKLREVEFT